MLFYLARQATAEPCRDRAPKNITMSEHATKSAGINDVFTL